MINLFEELKKANESDLPINIAKRLDNIEQDIGVLRSYRNF